MTESLASGLCTVNSLIIVFDGYLYSHYILWEASVHFQFLFCDHLLWRSKQLAIQDHGVSVMWIHLLNGSIMSFPPGLEMVKKSDVPSNTTL